MGKFDWYPGDDEPKVEKQETVQNPTKLRKGIEAGQVLILLTGRYRGKRVVFLRQLTSGLLLVTGPYRLNGVPLKRVPQSYTIATSTKLDIGGVDVSAIDDAFFEKTKEEKKEAREVRFFTPETYKRKETSDARKSAQKDVDAKIVAAAKKDPYLAKYLKARFSVTKGMKVHALKF